MNANANTLGRSPRLLVVGLLDSQFAIVRNEFPSLDLSHYKEGSHAKLDALQRNADRVLVITKFISHSVWDHVPRDKCAFFTGLDSLRARLAEYAADIAFRPNNVVPIRELADMGNPLCDYTPLATARTGTLLTFYRPDGVPAHEFAANVQAARMHYRRLCGVETTQEIHGGRAELFVTAPARFPILAQAEAALADPERVTFRLPGMDEQARAFWRDVYLASFRLNRYAPSTMHADNANAAVTAWLDVCGE